MQVAILIVITFLTTFLLIFLTIMSFHSRTPLPRRHYREYEDYCRARGLDPRFPPLTNDCVLILGEGWIKEHYPKYYRAVKESDARTYEELSPEVASLWREDVEPNCEGPLDWSMK